MWQLLLTGQANFINNDRVILIKQGSQIHLYTWPLAINVGMGTLYSTILTDIKDHSFRRKQERGLWEQQVAINLDYNSNENY